VRAIRSTILVALVLVPLAPLAATPADDHDIFLSTLPWKGLEPSQDLGGAAHGAGEALAALAGVETLPVACGTPLARSLAIHGTSAPLEAMRLAVAHRPALDPERVVLTPDGTIAVRFPGAPGSTGLLSADRDRNGTPDLVDRVLEALAASRSFLVTRLGYPTPVPDGGRLDVYLAELGHGLEGYTVPEGQGSPPFVVLDAGLLSDRVMPATIHQMAHLSLLSLSARAPLWWDEAGAAFLSLTASGDLQAHEAAIRVRAQAGDRGLVTDGLLSMEGTLLWPLFLSESTGDPGTVRAIWEEMATQGIDPLAATDQVLRHRGRSLAQAHCEFSAWNLFTGERDDGQHYASGRSLPAAPLATMGPETPFRVDPAESIEPLGAAAYRVPGDGRRGSLDLEITVEGGRPAADLLIFYHGGPAQPVLAGVTFDPSGIGRISLPSADVRETWVILRNDALPGTGGEARFAVRGSSDPYAPYDLASFTASASATSILLDWTTASEKDLAAWNVYRAETPAGPFTRLNTVAVPAAGDSAGDTGYIFLDDFARGGRRYYYQIEGITRSGLPQRSHVVSGRIPAAPASPSPVPASRSGRPAPAGSSR